MASEKCLAFDIETCIDFNGDPYLHVLACAKLETQDLVSALNTSHTDVIHKL